MTVRSNDGQGNEEANYTDQVPERSEPFGSPAASEASRPGTYPVFVAIPGLDGDTALYDIYVGETWIGSRSTITQCEEEVARYSRRI